MRVLMVAMQYPTGPGQSYLTTELAEVLVQAGHEVEVLHLDWHGAGGAGEVRHSPAGIRVVRCAPPTAGRPGSLLWRASKFVLGGRQLARVAARFLNLGSFDAAICWMPATAIAPLLPMLARAGIRRKLLFIWDFFPDHHHEIGRIPGGPPLWIARWRERRQLRHFTAILCTLPGNAAYLRRHFPVRAGQHVGVTPVWGDVSRRPPCDRAGVRARHGLPQAAPIAVFGGQLVAGRGFEQMLAAARLGRERGSPLRFLFVGDGSEADIIRSAAARADNVLWLPPLPRGDYLDLVAACDCGMVATVPGVRSFSFPSKLVDYLRAGVPVVAAIEHGSELDALIEARGLGRCVPFGDAAGFLAAAEALSGGRRGEAGFADAATRCLDEVFDVRHAVAAVEAGLGLPRPSTSGSTPPATMAAATG